MELFRLFGTIAVDNSEAVKNIQNTTSEAESASSKLSSVLSGIGGAVAKVGQVVATGVAAGAAAIGTVVTQAVSSYAEYEQLVGGVETLFADSSSKVMEYAANAYSTAGMSANEYMSTVTSFSASLLQSLGGDTAAAAEYADMAISDMADNANKMGTSMESIQNAYQGFAKQNYTMLDNLKLGYGGTQAEMERLIANANKVKKANGEMADLSIDSFADVVEAIHTIQEEMGIYGTTANEASTTIQGSLSATKAAWENLLVGFADGSQDLSVLIDNLVNSATIAVRNLVPRIAQALTGISDAIAQIMPIIAAELPGLMQQLLPSLITGATALVTGLIQCLPTILQILIAEIPGIVSQIAEAIAVAFPVLLDTVVQLFGQIWDYISLELLNTGVSFQDALTNMQTAFQNAWAVIQEIWYAVGQPIWDIIMSFVNKVKDAFAEKMPEIQNFVSDCFKDIKNLWENHLKPCLDAIGGFIRDVLAPIFDSVFNTTIVPIVDNAFNFIKSLWNDSLKPVLEGVCDFLTGVFTLDWQLAFDGLVSIVDGATNGIIALVESMVNSAINGLNGLIATINEVADMLGSDFEIPEIDMVHFSRVDSTSRDGTKFESTQSGGGRTSKSGTDSSGTGYTSSGGNDLVSGASMLARGGVLKRGQVGVLEGSGAEAVVPLENNRAWISKVAEDMNAAFGDKGSKQVEELKEAFSDFVQVLPDMMMDAFASMKFDVNNREFARMVKAVN